MSRIFTQPVSFFALFLHGGREELCVCLNCRHASLDEAVEELLLCLFYDIESPLFHCFERFVPHISPRTHFNHPFSQILIVCDAASNRTGKVVLLCSQQWLVNVTVDKSRLNKYSCHIRMLEHNVIVTEFHATVQCTE